MSSFVPRERICDNSVPAVGARSSDWTTIREKLRVSSASVVKEDTSVSLVLYCQSENSSNMLQTIASAANICVTSKEFAEHLDSNDELKDFQKEFLYPAESKTSSKQATYLCGNSLGIQPKGTRDYILQQLDKWSSEGVEGHFTEPTPWLTIDDIILESMARLVGALPSEVVLMNSLTVNLHLMMVSFYKPTATRHKILIEKKAFPSDVHAVVSQIQHHNFDPSISLIEVGPRDGEVLLRIEDIEAAIAAEGDSIALVLFSGVQYYTGQLFDMDRISKAAKAKGCNIGFDLAHAVGMPRSLSFLSMNLTVLSKLISRVH